MLVIHKFTLDQETKIIYLPPSHRVIACHDQDGDPHIWVHLDDVTPQQPYKFRLRFTGEPLTKDEIHEGTIFLENNNFVIHVTKEQVKANERAERI